MPLIPRFARYPLDKEAILSDEPERLLGYLRKLILELRKAYDDTYQAVREIGGYVQKIKNIAAIYTILEDDSVLLASATLGAFTITVKSAIFLKRKTYTVIKIDASANVITLDPAGAETINGAATKTLTAQWDKITIVSDGINWYEV